jgi:hypothetical protein
VLDLTVGAERKESLKQHNQKNKMKKLATLFVMMAVGLGNAWAQGQIDFHNPNTFPLRVQDAGGNTFTVGAAGSPLAQGSVRVGLFVGPNGSTSMSQMSMVGLVTNSSSTVPLFIGTFNGGTSYAITPSTQGAQVAFMFAAWSITTGSLTYSGAYDPAINPTSAGYAGTSLIGQNYTLGGGGVPPLIPAATFGSGVGQIPGFTLTPVPEPSTIVLGIIGVAALLLRRRK